MSSTKKAVTAYILSNAHLLSASYDTAAFSCIGYDRINLQINITASDAIGVFTVQCSIDGSNWVIMPLDAMAAASANKSIYIDIATTGIQQIRVDYVRTSGGAADTATIYVSARES